MNYYERSFALVWTTNISLNNKFHCFKDIFSFEWRCHSLVKGHNILANQQYNSFPHFTESLNIIKQMIETGMLEEKIHLFKFHLTNNKYIDQSQYTNEVPTIAYISYLSVSSRSIYQYTWLKVEMIMKVY